MFQTMLPGASKGSIGLPVGSGMRGLASTIYLVVQQPIIIQTDIINFLPIYNSYHRQQNPAYNTDPLLSIIIHQHQQQQIRNEQINPYRCNVYHHILNLIIVIQFKVKVQGMLRKALPVLSRMTFRNTYGLLEHKKMDELKAKLYVDQEKTLWLKTKFFLKEMKYTIAQGSKDLWSQAKWIRNLYKTKSRFEFTGYELSKVKRVIIDLLKFIPYSVILVVPFAQFSLPLILYLYPNAVPSFYLFDTAHDKRIKKLQQIQEDAHKILFQRLLTVLRGLSKRQQSFTHYDEFKTDFFQVIEDIDEKLNYKNFSSDQLITILQYLGGDYFQGTTTINKIVNFFTGIVPRWFIYKPYWFLRYKLKGVPAPKYEDPWWIKQNFKIFKFNYGPFETLKRKYLLSQIDKKFVQIKQQDLAFERYGMDDFKIYDIKYFAMERGFAPLTCYETLKNVVKNDWVKITTHPRFNNNTKLWYSVMMYHFLSQSNKDMN